MSIFYLDDKPFHDINNHMFDRSIKKKCLRFVVFLFAYLLLTVIFCESNAWATEVYATSLTVKDVGIVEVPVGIDNVEKLAGIKLVINFDKEMLSFKAGQKTKNTQAMMHVINDKNPGKLVIVMAGATGVSGTNFPLINLLFNVKNAHKSNFSTRIEIVECQLMSDKLVEIKCSVKPGIINMSR